MFASILSTMCMASFMMPYALHLIVSQGAVQLFQSSQSSRFGLLVFFTIQEI